MITPIIGADKPITFRKDADCAIRLESSKKKAVRVRPNSANTIIKKMPSKISKKNTDKDGFAETI